MNYDECNDILICYDEFKWNDTLVYYKYVFYFFIETKI